MVGRPPRSGREHARHTDVGHRPLATAGGETQRVAIGRALLARPDVLLLDEPLAALDATRKAEILPYLERLRSDAKLPILYVSHAVAEVARLATTVIVLEDGKVVRTGAATDVLSDPATVSKLGVREAGAVLQARVLHHHDDALNILPGTVTSLRQGDGPGVLVQLALERIKCLHASPAGLPKPWIWSKGPPVLQS